ncbi:MAG: hypothetical protein ACI9EW_002981 [Cellvibrionaceae bacterium]
MIEQPSPHKTDVSQPDTADVNISTEESKSETVQVNHHSRYVIQPILITMMVTAVGSAVLSLIAVGSSIPWHATIIPIFIMTLEGIFTAIWLSRPEQRHLSQPLYRGTEMLLMAIILRFFTWQLQGNWPQAAALVDYLREPFTLFGDPFYLVSLAIVFGTWGWAISISGAFQQMALDPTELRFYDVPVRDRPQVERPSTPFRMLHFEQFAMQWLWGGAFIALLAAVSTLDYGSLDSSNWRTLSRLTMPPGMLISLLIYFGAGFALISQGRLALMNARWLFSRVEKTVDVERYWARQTVWVLLITGGIAAFLPIGSTVLISQLIQFILVLIYQIISFFIFLFFLFASFFFPDRPISEAELEPFVPEPFTIPEAPPSLPAGEPGFPIIGTLFWIIMIGITIMAIIFFLRDRGVRLPQLNWDKLKAGFVNWWQSLWHIVVEQAKDLRDAVLTRLVREEIGSDGNQPWRFIRLNSLSPQQKLRYFYLSTVQRTEKGSLAKKESDTPLEYAAELKATLPESAQAIDTVTAGFLQARYANREITPADVEQVEPEWRLLRKAVKESTEKLNRTGRNKFRGAENAEV